MQQTDTFIEAMFVFLESTDEYLCEMTWKDII